MKKFGLGAIVASAMFFGMLGVASPFQAVATAETLPVAELPGYSTGVDHHQWIDTLHPEVTVPQVDTTVRHSH